MFKRAVASLLILTFAPLAIGCGGGVGQNTAANALKTPELPTDKQAKCRVKKSQAEPLIVEWPDAQRGKLESLTKRGVVAVRYEGCELEVLPRCSVKGNAYTYSPITRKQSTVTIKDEDELYASMPGGAIRLEGKLKSAGQLNVAMTMVGRYEAGSARVYGDDLDGDCSQATHVVAALTVGSFTFSAGADAEVGASANIGGAGAGGRSSAVRETLQRDGDEAACTKSSNADRSPPEHCGALLQIEVMPISKGSSGKAAAVAPVNPPPPVVPPTAGLTGTADDPSAPTGSAAGALTPAKPTTPAKPIKCKKGERVVDGVCVKPGTKPKTTAKVDAASGSLGGSSALRNVDPTPPPEPTCASGQHLSRGRCVDDEAPPPPPPENPSCPAGTHAQNGACVVDSGGSSSASSSTSDGMPSAYGGNAEQPPQEAPNPWRTTLLYLGVGAGVTGLTFGYLSLAAAEAATKLCSESTKTCTSEYDDKRSSATTSALVADIAFGVAALSFIGFVLLPKHVKVSAAPLPGGGGFATAGGTFK